MEYIQLLRQHIGHALILPVSVEEAAYQETLEESGLQIVKSFKMFVDC